MANAYKDVVVIGADGHGKTTLATAIGGSAAWSKAPFKVHDGLGAATVHGGAILVVDAKDEIQRKTRDDVAQARERGLAWIVVYLTKTEDHDEELLELLELECRELLTKYRYPGDRAAILRAVGLDELLAACTRAAEAAR